MNLPLVLLNRRRRGGLDAYREGGLDPALVFDFDDEYYRTGGSTSTFSDAITHSRTSNATMVDSDGLLKWAPHNLLVGTTTLTGGFTVGSLETVTGNATDGFVLQPTTANTQHFLAHGALTVSAATYTYEIEAKANGYNFIGFNSIGTPSVVNDLASVNLLDGTTVTQGGTTITAEAIGDGWYRVKYTLPYTASGSSALVYVYVLETSLSVTFPAYVGDGTSSILVRNPAFYRSDLGGMVDNPDTGNSYVPTTSSARYLARRGHHIWNGSAWVNEGLLHESEARTNLVTYSQDFTNAAWSKVGTATLAIDATGPDGETSAVTLVDSGATGAGTVYVAEDVTVSTSTVYTASVFAKAGQLDRIMLYTANFTTPANNGYVFNLATGAYSAYSGTPAMTPNIQDFGDGWYRCSVTFTTDAADTSGQIRLYVMDADGVGGEVVDLDGTSSVLIYGAQFEAAPTPSSYIPTSGATVTRAADTLTVPSANLPWPTPNVIGGELVEDGWTLTGSGITQSGQTFTITSAPVNTTIDSGAVTTAGKVYQYEFTVSGQTGSEVVRFQDSGFSTVIPAAGAAGDGTYTGVYVAQGNFLRIRIYNETADNVTATLSVREIDPLAVSIQMQGRATGNTYTPTRWYLDANNYITQEINSSDFTFEQAASGTVDAVTGGSFTSGVNTPFNFASTHASTLVAAAVGGTALTDNTTPVALPNLPATDLNLGHSFMGTLKLMRVWSANITEAGREEAST